MKTLAAHQAQRSLWCLLVSAASVSFASCLCDCLIGFTCVLLPKLRPCSLFFARPFLFTFSSSLTFCLLLICVHFDWTFFCFVCLIIAFCVWTPAVFGFTWSVSLQSQSLELDVCGRQWGEIWFKNASQYLQYYFIYFNSWTHLQHEDKGVNFRFWLNKWDLFSHHSFRQLASSRQH